MEISIQKIWLGAKDRFSRYLFLFENSKATRMLSLSLIALVLSLLIHQIMDMHGCFIHHFEEEELEGSSKLTSRVLHRRKTLMVLEDEISLELFRLGHHRDADKIRRVLEKGRERFAARDYRTCEGYFYKAKGLLEEASREKGSRSINR